MTNTLVIIKTFIRTETKVVMSYEYMSPSLMSFGQLSHKNK